MAQRIMALEVTGDRVRAAVGERSFKALEAVGLFEQQRAMDEPDHAPALARLLKEAGKPDVVLSALPGEFVAKRILALPFGDNRRLRQTVPFALEEHLPLPVDDAVVAFARVGQQDSETLVFAAFAAKSDLAEHLNLLAKVGLDPKIVTLSALALARLLALLRNGRARAHLLLDIEHDHTSVVLLDSNGTPRAVRTVGAHLEPNPQGQLPPAAASAILGTVRQTLLAHTTDRDQPQLVVAGLAAGSVRIRGQLAEALSLPVRGVDELGYPPVRKELKPKVARFAACLAMLMAEAPGKPLELLNFRQGEFAFRAGRSSQLAPFHTTGMLLAAAAAIGIVHAGFGISANLSHIHAIDQQIGDAAAPALGPVPPATVRTALSAKIKDMSAKLRMMGGGGGASAPLETLLALSRALPAGLSVEIEDLSLDDSGLKLVGNAASYAVVDQAKQALGRDGYFRDIQVTHATAAADPNKVNFRLSAELRDTLGGAE